MKKRQIIRLTESQLHRVIKESVKRVLDEDLVSYNNGMIEEGWKDLAMAGMVGVASLFGGQNDANAQVNNYNYHTPDSVVYNNCDNKTDSIFARKYWDREDMVTNNPISEKELAKLFPQAYKDRNKNSEVWVKNQSKYCGSIYGRMVLVGKVAASRGENPWYALVNKYTVANYNSKMK